MMLWTVFAGLVLVLVLVLLDTSIMVNTPVGMTESANVREVIGQGSTGGALASQANID